MLKIGKNDRDSRHLRATEKTFVAESTYWKTQSKPQLKWVRAWNKATIGDEKIT